jgi:hypothetical protein
VPKHFKIIRLRLHNLPSDLPDYPEVIHGGPGTAHTVNVIRDFGDIVSWR